MSVSGLFWVDVCVECTNDFGIAAGVVVMAAEGCKYKVLATMIESLLVCVDDFGQLDISTI